MNSALKQALKVMQFLGDSLDYSNFKNTVARTPDQQAKHDAYPSLTEKSVRGVLAELAHQQEPQHA